MNINATILGQVVAFILFVFFCMKYIWPPLINTIENRQREITNGLAYAERAKKDLDIAQIKASDYIKQAKVEAQAIIEQANKHKIQIINEAKFQAQVECSKIMTQTHIKIEIERKCLREELRKQVATLILASAEKIIGSSMNEIINNDIIDKIIAEL